MKPMPPREPLNKGDSRPGRPRWSSPLWYIPIMFLLLWLWQSTVTQFAYRNIPYSEFKAHLQNHELVKCLVREDDIQGEILLKPRAGSETAHAATTNTVAHSKPAPSAKPFLFRTVRVEKPNLLDGLQ